MVYVTLKEVEEVEGSSRHFRRPFSLVRFFLDEQKEMNINKKKEGVLLRHPQQALLFDDNPSLCSVP